MLPGGREGGSKEGRKEREKEKIWGADQEQVGSHRHQPKPMSVPDGSHLGNFTVEVNKLLPGEEKLRRNRGRGAAVGLALPDTKEVSQEISSDAGKLRIAAVPHQPPRLPPESRNMQERGFWEM